jgi:hypothetical protein
MTQNRAAPLRSLAALLALGTFAACAAPVPPDIRQTITPEAIATAPEPLLFVEFPQPGTQALMALAGRNGDVITWASADGRSISLRQGVLVATRGFGFDLMSADVTGTLAALSGGPRDYERHVSYLDGENRTVLRSFACRMEEPVAETIDSFGRSIPATRWTETCAGLDGTSTSVFHTGDGGMWRALQTVNQRGDRLLTERLNQ